MERTTLIIFVKAPVPGQVKTRLIPLLGKGGAAELYRAMAQDTLAVARRVPSVSVQVAYQTHPECPDSSWLSGQVSLFPQEGSDLGERLIHATQRVFGQTSAPMVIIGSDLPTLTPALIEKSLGLLRRAAVVLGPSLDGGYYLIGLQRPMPALFQGIVWSTPKVLEQTRQAMARKGLSVRQLPVRRDLDTPEDLAIAQASHAPLIHFPRTQEFLASRTSPIKAL